MDVYDKSPPLTHAQIVKPGSTHQASPAIIHDRITNFLKALLVVAGGDVHVVMDGLAPEAKISTQVDRLRTMAHQGEAYANTSKSQCKLLHLLAESAMIEALQDIMKEQSRLYLHLHRPDRGEAETYIDSWIQCHSDSTKEVFILSDDTDFLVYSSCPGFIPFKTLEFQILDGHLCLTGFEYQRHKFLHAFFSTADERAMTTVAALAGCDYGASDSLKAARNFIIQSNIGGLRPRQRNDPSSAMALTAVLRYVSHCTRKPSWQDVLAESVCKDPDKKSLLLTCLQDIHDIYFPIESTADVNSPPMSVECRRLLECGLVFCRPLIETWEGDNTVQSMSHSRKRPRNKGKKRRKKRHIMQQQVLGEDQSTNDLPLEMFVPFPPSDRYVAQRLATGSAWSVFSQVRRHLYADVRHYAQSQHDHRIRFHQTWTSSDTVVREYIRVGRSTHVDFVPKRIMVPAESSFNGTARSSLLYALDFCVVGENVMVPKSLLEQGGFVLRASLMLPAKSALFLFLLAKAPLSSAGLTMKASTCIALRDSLRLISLALFHASLIENAMAAFSEAKRSSLRLRRIQVSRILRHDIAAEIWAQMESIDDDLVMADDNGCAASCVHAVVFDKPEVSTMDWLPLITNELLTWRNDTKELWMTWCQIYRKQHGCL
jgi:hypothetical protein